MTTPTQAQIKQVWEYDKEELAEMYAIALCEIERLTAAAQVGEPNRLQALETAYVHASDEIERLNAARLADAKRMVVMSDEYEVLDAATIERCAQVAENYDQDDPAVQGRGVIAAAIRKLRDENE